MRVRIGIAAELKGVSSSTLRRWEKEGKLLPVERTMGGHRRYKLTQVEGKKENGERETKERIVLGYARVSATKQRKELERQQEQLKTFAQKQGGQLKKVYTDIA